MIGNNIKKWREIRNLKQSELAEILGVSDKTVSSWEINRTEPKMGMVEKISIALNCKKTDIIGEDTHTHNDISYELFYLNDETRMVAQEIFENDRVLFDVYRSSSKDRLIAYAKKLKELHDIEKMED